MSTNITCDSCGVTMERGPKGTVAIAWGIAPATADLCERCTAGVLKGLGQLGVKLNGHDELVRAMAEGDGQLKAARRQLARASAAAILAGVGAPLVPEGVQEQLASRLEASADAPGEQAPVSVPVAEGGGQSPYQPTGAGITGQAALDAHAAAIAESVAKRDEL